MTINLKETIKEIKAILTDLKTHADNNSALSGADKTTLEARLKHLLDKTQDHSKSPQKLDLDLQDLTNLDTLIGQDKTSSSIEKSKLEKEKKAAETERDNKNDELVKKQEELDKVKQEVGDKLTADLITKLETVAQSTPADQTAKLTEIKTIIEELKTKGSQEVNLTDITKKVDDLTTTANEIKEAKSPGIN